MTVTQEHNDASFQVLCGVRPFLGQIRSGDAVVLHRTEQAILVGLIDGLGHGNKAADIADDLKKYFEEGAESSPDVLLKRAHETFKGSQGACVGLAKVYNNGLVEFSGIGNIVCRIVTPYVLPAVSLISKDGALGIRSRSFEKTIHSMKPDDILFMHSDGISEHHLRNTFAFFSFDNTTAVAELIENFGKHHDDVSFLFLRFLTK